MCHVCIRYVTHRNEYVIHMNEREASHLLDYIVREQYLEVFFLCVTQLIHVRDMTHSYV